MSSRMHRNATPRLEREGTGKEERRGIDARLQRCLTARFIPTAFEAPGTRMWLARCVAGSAADIRRDGESNKSATIAMAAIFLPAFPVLCEDKM